MRSRHLLCCLTVGLGVAAAVILTAPPAGAQPAVTVIPAVDLVDLQTVAVSGSGFPASTSLALAMCTAAPSSSADCDLATATIVASDVDGAFSTQRIVERIIRTPAAGQVDCGVAPATCAMGVGTLDGSVGAAASLEFDPDVLPPPLLEVDLLIHRVGTFSPRTGRATVTGTVSCSKPAQALVEGTTAQDSGREVVEGYFLTVVSCDGPTPWTAEVGYTNGRHVGGPLDVALSSFARSGSQHAGAETSATIFLRAAAR